MLPTRCQVEAVGSHVTAQARALCSGQQSGEGDVSSSNCCEIMASTAAFVQQAAGRHSEQREFNVGCGNGITKA